MKKRKLNINLLAQLEELRKTRNSIDEYYYNFLNNISKNSYFMHYVIKTKPTKEVIKVPIAQYLVSLIGCWETFLRDIFVFVCERDKAFRDFIIIANRIDQETISQMDSNLLLAEYLSKLFNFQNLNDIERAFEPLFNLKLFDTIGSYELTKLSIKARLITDFSILKLVPNWIGLVEKAYSERHKIVHDANYIKDINIETNFIQLLETVFIIFPQIFAFWLSEKYSLDHYIISMNFNDLTLSIANLNKDSAPFLFLVEDLISDDWIVVNDGGKAEISEEKDIT